MNVDEAIAALTEARWTAKSLDTRPYWDEEIVLCRWRGKSGEYELYKAPIIEEGNRASYDAVNLPEDVHYLRRSNRDWMLLQLGGTGGQGEFFLKAGPDLATLVKFALNIDSFAPRATETWPIGADMTYLQYLGLICELHDLGTVRVKQTRVPYVDMYYCTDFMWIYSTREAYRNTPEMLVRSDGTQWIVEGEGSLVEASAPGRFDNLKDLAYTLEKTLNRPRFDT